MISARLRELRIAANFTQKDIAISVNRTQQAVAKWEKGLAEPDASCIVTLANLFAVSTDYLLGCEKKPTVQAGELPKSERDLLDLFHRLNADGQKALLAHADLLISSGQFSRTEGARVG